MLQNNEKSLSVALEVFEKNEISGAWNNDHTLFSAFNETNLLTRIVVSWKESLRVSFKL